MIQMTQKLSMLAVGVAAALAIAAPAGAADNQASLIRHLRGQVASLKHDKQNLARQRDSARAGRDAALKAAKADLSAKTVAVTQAQTSDAALIVAQGQLTAAQASVAALTPALATAQAALSGPVSQQLSAMTQDQLWGLMPFLSARMQGTALCGFSSTFFQGSALSSYDFDKYVC